MADQIDKCNMNNVLILENAFNVNAVKKEECQEDDKSYTSENAIFINSGGLPNHLIPDKMEQYDISTTLDNIKTEPAISEVKYNMIHENIKIEEGIKADDIKVEFNNGPMYCEHCHAYYEDYCTKCGMLVHILNKYILINADGISQEVLPPDNILEIQEYFGEHRIFALKVIPAGVRFGPFNGLNRSNHPWRIKGGKFLVNKAKSKYLNWMECINSARIISEQNLRVFQYECNVYYESTCQIQAGDELLVYFGEEYEDSLSRNVGMNFIPATEYTFKNAFACMFCCLGFSSKSYLVKHKTICLGNSAGEFSIEELMQCPSCKVYLDSKEHVHHMAYCCGKSYKKYNQRTDVNRCTRPRLTYKCQQCKYRTKYKRDLKNHTNQHYKVKMYKCGVCCRRFNTKDVLKRHMRNAHICAVGEENSELFTTVYVNAQVKPEYSCSQYEIKKFKCSLCDYKSNWEWQLKRHVETRHLKEYKYKCDACQYQTSRKYNLEMHIKTKHLKLFKYTCDICDHKTHFKSNLKRHIETTHLKDFKYKCDTCDYETHRKSALKRHVEAKHLKEFKYKCDACDYKSNQKCDLKRHVETRHSTEFKYLCDTCDYKSNWKDKLKAHIETIHLNVFKYKCDTCDYKSNLKAGLKRHVAAIHLKELKYKCDACDYKANQMTGLKRHVEAIHLKEFKYKCDLCDYKSNQKAGLKRHVDARHLKEFKYKCDTCDYKTNQKYDLKRHVEARHLKEFKYKCDMCDHKTNKKSDLMVHIKSKHLNEFN